jgi:hypothetical protein
MTGQPIEVAVEVTRVSAATMTDYPEGERRDHWQVVVVHYHPDPMGGYVAEGDDLFRADDDADLADAVRDALASAETARRGYRLAGEAVADA